MTETWILAGQSNMQGVGRLDDADPPDPHVEMFGIGRGWMPAVEPISSLGRRAPHNLGAGPGLAFGRALNTDVGLIPCARGGASMADWKPGSELYSHMLRAAELCGRPVTGVLWYQGEADSDPRRGGDYESDFRSFIQSVRTDLGDVRFIHAQLSRFVYPCEPEVERRWCAIREVQRRYTDVGSDGFVATIDLPLEDFVHIATSGSRRLGQRFARIARGEPSLTVRSVETGEWSHEGPLGWSTYITVTYDGVAGSLQPSERVAGFEIRRAGEKVPCIAQAKAEGRSVRLRLMLPDAPSGRLELWYGYGADPFCNLVDGADVAAPAFGPWELSSS